MSSTKFLTEFIPMIIKLNLKRREVVFVKYDPWAEVEREAAEIIRRFPSLSPQKAEKVAYSLILGECLDCGDFILCPTIRADQNNSFDYGILKELK